MKFFNNLFLSAITLIILMLLARMMYSLYLSLKLMKKIKLNIKYKDSEFMSKKFTLKEFSRYYQFTPRESYYILEMVERTGSVDKKFESLGCLFENEVDIPVGNYYKVVYILND